MWFEVYIRGIRGAHLRGDPGISNDSRSGATFVLPGDEPQRAPGQLDAGPDAVRGAKGAEGLGGKPPILERFESFLDLFCHSLFLFAARGEENGFRGTGGMNSHPRPSIGNLHFSVSHIRHAFQPRKMAKEAALNK